MKAGRATNRFVDIFGLKIYKYTPGIKSFLENNPFVCTENEFLKSMVFISKDHRLSLKEINHFKKTYFFPGISELIVVPSDNLYYKPDKERSKGCDAI